MLDWRVEPVQKFRETRTGGVIVCNPPYGERLLENRVRKSFIVKCTAFFAA